MKSLLKKHKGVKEGLGHSLKSCGESKRGFAPLQKFSSPFPFEGEGG